MSNFLTMAILKLMANRDGEKVEGESVTPEIPRHAGSRGNFDEDTDEAIVLPKPVPEISDDDDADKRKADSEADSAFDDLEIEVDEQEVKAESENQPDGRKY